MCEDHQINIICDFTLEWEKELLHFPPFQQQLTFWSNNGLSLLMVYNLKRNMKYPRRSICAALIFLITAELEQYLQKSFSDIWAHLLMKLNENLTLKQSSRVLCEMSVMWRICQLLQYEKLVGQKRVKN